MRWWLKIRKRWALDRELREEIAFHRAMRLRDKEHSENVPPFGNETQIREEMRDMWTFVSIETAWRDVCYAFRGLRRNPAFTVIGILTLAIGIGANTGVFSVVNGVLINPLPYPHSDQLVGVWHTAPGLTTTGPLNCSPSMYFTYREESQTFQDFGLATTGGTSVTGLGEPEQVRTLSTTYGTLQALGVQPLLGRWFSQADDSPGGTDPDPVMLGYGYWQRRFGGDKTVLGRGLTVDSRLRQIVGVMPAGFRFLNVEPELITTQRFDRSRGFYGNFGFQGIARLKPGVTLAQANADLDRVLTIWKNAWPEPPGAGRQIIENWKIKPALRPLKQDVVGDTGNVLWVLMGTIGVVLLIACANVANLLLVRAQARQQELAIRAALGAGRGRIAGELLIESLLLGLMGGAAGLGLAYGGLRLLVAIGPANLPRLSEISIDLPTLAFTLAASVVSGLLFGLMPTLKYAGARTATALRSGGRTSSQSQERHRASNALVVVQVSLALVLLVSSGLMIRTFQALRRVDPGFTKPESLQIFRILLLRSQDQPEQVARRENAILDKLAAIPGVSSVAFSSTVPLDGRLNRDPVWAEDKVYSAGETPPLRTFRYVSPGFFGTAGTELIAGRDLTWTDLYGHRPVALVSENLARELWGAPTAAVGKRIHEPGLNPPWREIIGVARDVRNDGVQFKAPSIVYWPTRMENHGGSPVTVVGQIAFTIRSDRAGTERFLNEARQAVWSVNPNLPVFLVSTMRELYDRSLAATSFSLVMLAIAGMMALLLGLIGIYGVISYSVSQQTREIGIRLALGAEPGELKRMFVRNGLTLAGIGVMIGLGAAAALTRLMKSLLFGISPLDPLTYVATPCVLVAAATLASYLPARRAARVDPMEALRME